MGRLDENFIVFTFLFDDEYGRVFRAYNRKENRKVWIKEIHDYLLKDEWFKNSLLEKVEKVKNLNHRNIQKLYDYWEEDGKLFLELENLRGTFLDEVIYNPKRLDKFEIISIAYQLFTALSYAHQKGIFHENVRPEHITIERNGDIKITNFMMPDPMKVYFLRVKAKVMADDRIEFYKFVRFASPWHLRGHELDWKADFFSAAVTLFELATKDTPWDRSSPHMFYSTVRDPKTVRYIWQTREDLPPYFSLMISNCLTDHEYWRGKFRDEIFETLQDTYDEIVKPVLEKRKKKRESKEKIQKLLTYSIGVLLTLGLLIFPFQKKNLEGDTSIPISVLPVENRTNDPSLIPVAEGITKEIVESLSYVNPLCVIPSVNLEKSNRLKTNFVLRNEIIGGEKIEFDSKLFRAKNGKLELIRSSRFNIKDIPSLKFYLSRDMMQALKLDFKGEDETRTLTKRISPEVYNLYLNSLYWYIIFLKDPKKEYLELSKEFLLRANDLDKKFAPVYSALASNALFQLEYGFSNDPELIEFAKKMCLKALEIEKEDTRARAILAILYMKENKKLEAYKELSELYKKNPKNPVVIGALGSLYQYSGLLEKAIDKYKRVKKSNPLDLISSINIGRVYMYEGKFSKAEKELSKVMKKSDHPYAFYFLSLNLSYMGRIDDAEVILKKAIEKYPNEKDLKIPLAIVYMKRNKLEKDEEVIKELEEQAKRDADKAYQLSIYYSLKNDKASAIKWLKISIKNGNENYVLFSKDPYLKILRGEREFEEMMREIEKKWKIYKKEFTL